MLPVDPKMISFTSILALSNDRAQRPSSPAARKRSGIALRTSRLESFEFRSRFVFPVATRFLWWCHKISTLLDCTSNPSQNRTRAVNASASQPTPLTRHAARIPRRVPPHYLTRRGPPQSSPRPGQARPTGADAGKRCRRPNRSSCVFSSASSNENRARQNGARSNTFDPL